MKDRGILNKYNERRRQRSRFNATKYGLSAKVTLLPNESEQDFLSMLRGMFKVHQPSGVHEEELVVRIANLTWRLRRGPRAEAAEIAQGIERAQTKYLDSLISEADSRCKFGLLYGGMLHRCCNPMVMDCAIKRLMQLRAHFEDRGLDMQKDLSILFDIYGPFEQAGDGESFPRRYLSLADFARDYSANRRRMSRSARKAIQDVIDCINAEIKRIESLKVSYEEVHSRRQALAVQAMLVPKAEVADRLQRYESHLSREIDRTLKRLERLQRIRFGQALPPQI